MPLVSIVMNCYNGEKYLKEAIDSIFNQTISDWEIIFWDNCSTDKSAEIALSYSNEKLHYFLAEKNEPLSTARNLAVKKARGKWIAFLDVDDIWFPHKLERQLAFVEGSDYPLCYAGIVETTKNLKPLRKVFPRLSSGHMVEQQIAQYDINMVTPILRRSFLEKHNLNFEPGLTCYADQNLFIRIAAKAEICVIKELLGIYRVLPGSLSEQTLQNWGSERRFNLNQLEAENPGISDKYPVAFAEAFARAVYYDARFLMKSKKYSEARHLLRDLRILDIKYFLLWVLSYTPLGWNLAHSIQLRGKLSLLLSFCKLNSY